MATAQNLKTRDGFGDGAELENSFIIRVEDKNNNVVVDLSAGVPITTNNDLTLYASADVMKESQDLIKIGDFAKRFGNPIKIRGNIGEKVVVRVNDNMSNRVERLYVILSGSKD